MSGRQVPAPLIDAVLVLVALADAWARVSTESTAALGWAVLAAFALALRRRLPMTAFLLTLPTALFTDAVFATMAALYTLSSLSRHRVMLGCCALVYAFIDFMPWPWSSLEPTELGRTDNLLHLSYSLATAVAPVALGQLVQAQRDLSLRLTEISEAREQERHMAAQSILAQERAQLAREMHDVVSHQVSLIAVQAGALQVGSQDDETKKAAATIRQLSVQTLDELRHMVGVLRASGSRPTELTPQPSLADLRSLVDSSGIDTELKIDLPEELPPTVQRAVYRTVQEALTNVRKHAPGAGASVHIHQADGAVHTTVTNDAPTLPVLSLPSAQHGLAGLRQRAELLGGTVSCGPTAEGGFTLHLSLPVEPNR